MKKSLVLPLFFGLVLLTGCGSHQIGGMIVSSFQTTAVCDTRVKLIRMRNNSDSELIIKGAKIDRGSDHNGNFNFAGFLIGTEEQPLDHGAIQDVHIPANTTYTWKIAFSPNDENSVYEAMLDISYEQPAGVVQLKLEGASGASLPSCPGSDIGNNTSGGSTTGGSTTSGSTTGGSTTGGSTTGGITTGGSTTGGSTTGGSTTGGSTTGGSTTGGSTTGGSTTGGSTTGGSTTAGSTTGGSTTGGSTTGGSTTGGSTTGGTGSECTGSLTEFCGELDLVIDKIKLVNGTSPDAVISSDDSTPKYVPFQSILTLTQDTVIFPKIELDDKFDLPPPTAGTPISDLVKSTTTVIIEESVTGPLDRLTGNIDLKNLSIRLLNNDDNFDTKFQITLTTTSATTKEIGKPDLVNAGYKNPKAVGNGAQFFGTPLSQDGKIILVGTAPGFLNTKKPFPKQKGLLAGNLTPTTEIALEITATIKTK